MWQIVLRVIYGVIGTLGFALIFKLKPKHIPVSLICGLISCVVYFALFPVFDDYFIPNLVAAFATAAAAYIFAVLCKTPSTVFLITGCITLVPGSFLFYGIKDLVNGAVKQAGENLLTTLTVSVAIGSGILLASLLHKLIHTTMMYFKTNK